MAALRVVWGLFFIASGVFNFAYTMQNLEVYNEFADMALFSFYVNFIEDVVIPNGEVFTATLAVFELLVGGLILAKGMYAKVGLIASLIFTVALIPAIVPYTYVNILLALIPIMLFRNKLDESVPHYLNDKRKHLRKTA